MIKFCFTAMLLILASCCALAWAQPAEPADAAQPDATAGAPAGAPAPARRPPMPNVITFESALGEVRFPHRVHQKMGCQNCHHQIHAKDLATPHEAYLGYSWVNCQDCHNPDSATNTSYYGCAKCHHTNLENIADETLSAKVVVHKSCWKCHQSGTGVAASEGCGFCHLDHEPSADLSSEASGQ